MATSSIKKNFVISGQKQVEKFIEAIEASAKNRPERTPVAYHDITDDTELIDFMRKRKRNKASDNRKLYMGTCY